MEHILDKTNIFNKDAVADIADKISNGISNGLAELNSHINNGLQLFKTEVYDNHLYVAKEFEDAKLPTQEDESAGWDLYAYKDVCIQPGHYELVPIGCRITVDIGWWYSIYPRSSLDFKKSVAPKPGSVFDATYTGNMDIKMYNKGTEPYVISKGDKFCQVVVHKKHSSKLSELSVDELEHIHKDGRGNNGWGSSGK